MISTSSFSSSSLPVESGLAKDTLLNCLISLTNEKLDTGVFASMFPDIAFCILHKAFVARNMLATGAIDQVDPFESCGICPRSKYREINIDEILKQHPSDLVSARNAWLGIIGQSENVNGPKRKQTTVTMTIDDLNKKVLEERVKWLEYMHAAYATGKKRISLMKLQYEGAEAHYQATKCLWKADKTTTSYDDELMHFYNHSLLRASRSTSKRENTCKTYCHEHDAIGDFVPYRPLFTYKACIVCEKPKPPRPLLLRSRQVDEKNLFENVRTRD